MPTDPDALPAVIVSSSEDQPAALPADAEIFGVPAAVFVRGGTTSSRHDRAIAEQEADAEQRRNMQDAERRAASVPIEQGGAKLYNNFLNDGAAASPKVLLKYMTPAGEQEYFQGEPIECLADIVTGVDPGGPDKLALILVCPWHMKRGMPEGQAQIKLCQSNRWWELDMRKQGEAFRFKDPMSGKYVVYPSAGTVSSERFSCECGWAARIDKNRVIPDR